MKDLKSIVFLLFVLILAFFLVGCVKKEDPAQVDEMDTIRLAMLPYFSNTVFQIAIEEGYFEEQDINVEVVQLQSALELVPLLVSGEFDASAPGLSAALFNAFSKEAELKVIFPLTQFKTLDCSYTAWVARTEDVEAGIYDNMADWADASIVVSNQGLNSIPGYNFAEMLAGSGLKIDEMNVVNVEIPAYEDALLSGQADIIYALEPSLTRLLTNEDISILRPVDPYFDGFAVSLVTVGPKIYENEDLANRFAIAYLKAVRQYLDGPTERNVEFAAKLTGLDEELVKDICWSYTPPDGKINLDSIDAYQKFLMERGLLDEFVSSDVYYDPSFAEFAVQYLSEEE